MTTYAPTRPVYNAEQPANLGAIAVRRHYSFPGVSLSDETAALTELLTRAESGDERAAAAILPLVYDELRRLAHAWMARERPGHTLQPTALVHEAYLRLIGKEGVEWSGRAHFFGAAANAMRRILVERARRVATKKRGGDHRRLSLEDADLRVPERPEDVIALDEALERLKSMDRRKHDVVMLRFFSGLTVEEAALALGVSRTTVKDDWSFARAWLLKEVARGNT